MKDKKTVFTFFNVLVVLVTVLSSQVFAESTTVIDSGYCGENILGWSTEFGGIVVEHDNLTWTLYDDGTLAIEGEGDMDDYVFDYSSGTAVPKDAPWIKYKEQLKTLKIGDGVKSIGKNAFSDCSSFTGSLVIPESVIKIESSAFWGCSGFTELVFGDKVKKIGDTAFSNCTGFKGQLALPNDLEEIGTWAFNNCSGFTGELVIPDKVNRIWDWAFDGCSGLTSVSLPNSLTYIHGGAFMGCSGLSGRKLFIPESVINIGEYSFTSQFMGVYFNGNAPKVVARNLKHSFNENATLYYIPGTSGWTDSENYDASAGTWNGYELKTWDGIIPSTPSEWAKDEVNAAIEAGLVPISIQKKYNKPVTRGEVAGMFITLLENSYGKSVDEIMKDKGVSINENAFTDTNDKAVLAANALGIINGVGNGKFSPDGTLKRAHIAAIINRVAGVLGAETDGYTHSFTDITDNYQWADAELGWPVSVEIIKGVGEGKFNPGGELTTEQAIVITYRALNVLTKNKK